MSKIINIETMSNITYTKSKDLLNNLIRNPKRVTSTKEISKVIKKDMNDILKIKEHPIFPSEEELLDIMNMRKRYNIASATLEWQDLITSLHALNQYNHLCNNDTVTLTDDMKKILERHYIREQEMIVSINRYKDFYDEYQNFQLKYKNKILLLKKMETMESHIKELKIYIESNPQRIKKSFIGR